MGDLHENELQLLQELRQNSRVSLLEVSRQLNMPKSTVHEKVKRLYGSVIIKHTTLLDFSKLGYCRQWLAVKTTPHARHIAQAFLEEHRGVNNLYKINSGFDFLAEIVCQDLKEIEDFAASLKKVTGVNDVLQFSIVQDMKREEFGVGK